MADHQPLTIAILSASQVSTNNTLAQTSFQPNPSRAPLLRAFTTATPTPTASARLSCCCRNPFATDSTLTRRSSRTSTAMFPALPPDTQSPLPLRPHHPLATSAAVITRNEAILGIFDPYTITMATSVVPDKDVCRLGLHRVVSNGALRTIRENRTMMGNKREQDMRNGS